MKLSKIISIITVVCILLMQGAATVVFAAEDTSGNYDYFLQTSEENAYVMFDEKIEERFCSYIDGRAMGIDDSTNALYSEVITLDGLKARYFNNKNVANIAVNKSFYDENDHEFVFSIVFYDFGPSQGTFYFEYNDLNGEVKRITLIKPGKIQGWFVKTVCVDDADLSKTFDENGGNIRLVTGGYNAFKKVEITNLSKLNREGKGTNLSALSSEYAEYFKQERLIESNDTTYTESNMYRKCTGADAYILLRKICGGDTSKIPSEYNNSQNPITLKELTTLYLNVLGIEAEENVINQATVLGIVTLQDLFLDENAEASYYNLLGITYNSFYYEPKNGKSLAERLIATGEYIVEEVKSFTDPKFLEIYYDVPIKCPYKKITDYETGRTVYYMNFFGSEALRPYVTMQSWTSDGKSFIGGTKTGYMFLYNTETQMLTFVDDNMNYYGAQMINATIGTDDCIYYVKKDAGKNGIWKCDIKTLEKTKITDIAENVTVGGVSITNDCKYIGFDYSAPYNTEFPPGIDLGARYCIETDIWDVFPYEFSFHQHMNHVQINPTNPELMFFCHEGGGDVDSGISLEQVYDRVWTYDYSTGIAKNIFKQGEFNGFYLQGATHEVWSCDGQYLFLIIPEGINGKAPSVVRIDYDGRHRQYYYNPSATSSYWHCNPSGDGKYVVADGNYMTVINTETNQSFKITRWIGHGKAQHPYHPHPHVARNQYIANWGMLYQGILGIMWYDFSEIDKSEIANGGRYPVGENLERVSYEKLPCETKETYKTGKACYYVKPGNALYLDIDENLVDSVNDSVTVSFDYLDSGRQPIVLTYTSGVNTDNDYWKIDNANKSVKRTGSGTWKHAEISIESGNFENPGEYSTDLKIKGVGSNLYITNIKVRKGK